MNGTAIAIGAGGLLFVLLIAAMVSSQQTPTVVVVVQPDRSGVGGLIAALGLIGFIAILILTKGCGLAG